MNLPKIYTSEPCLVVARDATGCRNSAETQAMISNSQITPSVATINAPLSEDLF